MNGQDFESLGTAYIRLRNIAFGVLTGLVLILVALAFFLSGCGPNHPRHRLYNWPTGPSYQCDVHTIVLPASVWKQTAHGFVVDEIVKDRVIHAIKVQIEAFEHDENMTLRPTLLGVTDQQSFPWCGGFVAGGWEGVDDPSFSNAAINSIGTYENVWPVYHELHHIVFGDPFHQDPRWMKWNARMNELAALNAARPYPPGVDPFNH